MNNGQKVLVVGAGVALAGFGIWAVTRGAKAAPPPPRRRRLLRHPARPICTAGSMIRQAARAYPELSLC